MEEGEQKTFSNMQKKVGSGDWERGYSSIASFPDPCLFRLHKGKSQLLSNRKRCRPGNEANSSIHSPNMEKKLALEKTGNKATNYLEA